jgi:hypothetical protein
MHSNALPSYTYYVPAAMLLLALLPLPYGFYTLLRLVVVVCAAILAYHHWQSGGKIIVAGMGFVALLFNPLFPIYLSREIWAPIDIACALYFGIIGFKNGA